MHLRDGYCEGWNSALSSIQTAPVEKFKYIKAKNEAPAYNAAQELKDKIRLRLLQQQVT